MQFDTPILFIIFNRPVPAQKVFDVIRERRPSRLYVAADGPRSGKNEEELCEQTRAIIEQIDWDCKLYTQFRDKNLGCGLGPKTAVDWFFEQEEEGIILEDDCVPHSSFFTFCAELLARYKEDTRVMHISGSKFNSKNHKSYAYSYHFSQFGHEWGWASWRRAWKYYDFEVSSFEEVKRKGYLDEYFSNFLMKKYRLSKVEKTAKLIKESPNLVNWWDYQWEYAKMINSGLSITPSVNLIENIGFGEDATHTKSANDYRRSRSKEGISFPLKHPPFVIRDVVTDKNYFSDFFMQVILLRKAKSYLGIKGYDLEG